MKPLRYTRSEQASSAVAAVVDGGGAAEHLPDAVLSSWALLAGSYSDQMDANMVLTGISMAFFIFTSPHGDALYVAATGRQV